MAVYNPNLPFFQFSTQSRTYDLVLRCETNNTSAPDGADPGSTVGAWDQTATGVYTFTFASGYRPDEVMAAHCYLEETDIVFVKLISYVASTGVATFHAHAEAAGGTGTGDGVFALADSTDKTLVCWLKCRDL